MMRRLTQFGWLLVAVGFAAIGAGWSGVQSTPVVAVQLSYLVSGGMVGIALVILGTGLMRQDDVRAIREMVEELRDRFDDLERDLEDQRPRLAAVEESRAAENPQGRRSRRNVS